MPYDRALSIDSQVLIIPRVIAHVIRRAGHLGIYIHLVSHGTKYLVPWYHMMLVLRGASVVSSGAVVSSATGTTWY